MQVHPRGLQPDFPPPRSGSCRVLATGVPVSSSANGDRSRLRLRLPGVMPAKSLEQSLAPGRGGSGMVAVTPRPVALGPSVPTLRLLTLMVEIRALVSLVSVEESVSCSRTGQERCVPGVQIPSPTNGRWSNSTGECMSDSCCGDLVGGDRETLAVRELGLGPCSNLIQGIWPVEFWSCLSYLLVSGLLTCPCFPVIPQDTTESAVPTV